MDNMCATRTVLFPRPLNRFTIIRKYCISLFGPFIVKKKNFLMTFIDYYLATVLKGIKLLMLKIKSLSQILNTDILFYFMSVWSILCLLYTLKTNVLKECVIMEFQLQKLCIVLP